MDSSQLLPQVVHRDYFNAAGIADVDAEPERFGFVSHLGHDVYTFWLAPKMASFATSNESISTISD